MFARRYVYDGQEILVEYDGSNNILARYTHSGLRTDDVMSVYVTSSGQSAGLAQSSGSYYYGKDALGSISVVADSSGNKLQRYVYGAFGTLEAIKDASGNDITSSPVLSTAFTYTGREYDKESGLYYYRARYYDASVGRFLQKDPEPGRLGLPVSIVNSYVAVGNNPVNIGDPSGRGWWSSIRDTIINTVAFVGLVSILPGAFLINPSWTTANLLKTLNLSLPGNLINLAVTGTWAREGSFMGRTTVENSMFAGKYGFTPGPVSFLPPDAREETRYHEIGHQLQYENFDDGWEYFTKGTSSMWIQTFGDPGPYDTPFECEAGTLSHDTFSLSYYPDTGYNCPGR